MINKFILIAATLLFANILAVHAQENAVVIHPTKASPKDEVNIKLLANKVQIPDSIKQLFLQFSYSNFYEMPQRLEMKKVNQDWEVNFKLPFYANYSSFFITSADQKFVIRPTDTTHYEIFVYEGNKLKEGNYLAKGYSTAYQNRNSKSMEQQQLAYFLKEQQLFPTNYENNLKILQYRMKTAKDEVSKEKYRQQALQVIEDKFRSNPTVDGNLNKVTMGFLIIGEKQKVDSIRNVVIKEFPNSNLGMSYTLGRLLDIPDTAVVITEINKLLPKKTKDNEEAFQSAYSYLFEYYVGKKDADKALSYYPFILDKEPNPYTWRTYTYYVDLLIDNNILLDKAQELNNLVLNNIADYPVTLVRYFPETGYLVGHDDARQEKINKVKSEVLLRQGLIQQKTGHKQEAYALLAKNYPLVESKDLLKKTAQVFADNKDIDQELQVWSQAYKLTPYDSTIRTSLSKTLLKQNKSDEEIRSYVNGLDLEWKGAYFKSLEKKVIKGEIFPSELSIKDMSGKALTSQDLQGKVVVIDLWATWCVPCLASFPYVHQVYLKYKDNPKVKFVILNTGSGNTFEDAKNWVDKNPNYTFPVYYNSDKTFNGKLDVNTIPTTFILGPNQNIVFKKVGSEGEKILQDLDAMIDFVLQH
ncbi:TlpA family protein disulfide reductase [Sphingobacterium lactis]|uniref:TlpA family protein disulfide reductase n=1 Tax=Sphingobacterium lactis TaxID=797291 RepID=UPI003F7D8F4C